MSKFKDFFKNSFSKVGSPRRAQGAAYFRASSDPLQLESYLFGRTYKDKSNLELLNQLVVNVAVQNPVIVDKADALYNLSRIVLGSSPFPFVAAIFFLPAGQKLSEKATKRTIGKVFTGGSTFEEVRNPVAAYNQRSNYLVVEIVTQ